MAMFLVFFVLALPSGSHSSGSSKKRAFFFMTDKVNLLQEVLANPPFDAEDPMPVWTVIARNVTEASDSGEFSPRSVKDHFELLLKYHRQNDRERLKK